MTDNNPAPNNSEKSKNVSVPDNLDVSPLQCLMSATIAGTIGYGVYWMTQAIATSFANKPIHSDNTFVINISAAVRSLVIGIASLASSMFAIVTLGLIALAIQLTWQRLTKKSSV
ncbi:MAG: DUF3082 domain-containing protein [Microcoleaceae cyanobacterium]